MCLDESFSAGISLQGHPHNKSYMAASANAHARNHWPGPDRFRLRGTRLNDIVRTVRSTSKGESEEGHNTICIYAVAPEREEYGERQSQSMKQPPGAKLETLPK